MNVTPCSCPAASPATSALAQLHGRARASQTATLSSQDAALLRRSGDCQRRIAHGARGIGAARDAQRVEVMRHFGEMQRLQACPPARPRRRARPWPAPNTPRPWACRPDRRRSPRSTASSSAGARSRSPLQVGERAHRPVARDDAGQVAALHGEHHQALRARARTADRALPGSDTARPAARNVVSPRVESRPARG